MTTLSLSPKLLKRMAPTRTHPPKIKLDPKKLSQAVAEHLSHQKESWERGVTRALGEVALAEEMLSFIQHPTKPSRDLAVATIEMGLHGNNTDIRMRWLVAHFGLTEAINISFSPRTLVEAYQWHEMKNSFYFSKVTPREINNNHRANFAIALRPLAMCATASEYADACAWISSNITLADDLIFCAYLLNDHALAARAADATLGIPPKRFYNRDSLLLGVLNDPVRANAFVDNHRISFQSSPPPEAIQLLQALAPQDAEAILLKLLSDESSDQKFWLQALSGLSGPTIAQAFASRLSNKKILPLVSDYFESHPELAEAALGPFCHSRKKAEAEVAQSLLSAIKRKNTSTSVHYAPLPEILKDPPWLKKPSALPVADYQGPIPRDHIGVASFNLWKNTFERTPEKDQQVLPDPNALIGQTWGASHRLFQLTDDYAIQVLEQVGLHLYLGPYDLEQILGRFGDRFIALACQLLRSQAESSLFLLKKLRGPSVALIMAHLLQQKPLLKNEVGRYLMAHYETALPGLIQAALVADDRQDIACFALRWYAAQGLQAPVMAAARAGGVEAPIQTLLAIDPLQFFPTNLPKLPAFFDPEALPALMLADGTCFSPDAMRHIGAMLQISHINGWRYAGLDQMRALATPESLDVFAKALMEAWEREGGPPRYEWAMGSVAWLGGPESVRALQARMFSWPKEGKVDRMHRAAEILAEQGSELALMLLYLYGQRSRYADTQDLIRDLLKGVAQERGISVEDLEDRLAPDLGLDPQGQMHLDYGSRSFRVLFDENITPYLVDAAGQRLSTIPASRKADDTAKVEEAKARFRQLREDVEDLGKAQLLRLERALATQRSWHYAALQKDVIQHPLLGLLARRLLWRSALGCFRVAEDGSLADVHDHSLILADDTDVWLAHPRDVPVESLTAWQQIFSDYGILQPFPQLTREVFVLTPEEQHASTLPRCVDLPAAYPRVIGLISGRGWRRTPPDGGTVKYLEKPLSDHVMARLSIFPGLYVGPVKGTPAQTIKALSLSKTGEALPLGHLDPLTASELLRDVLTLGG